MSKQEIPPFVCQARSSETKTSICFRFGIRYCYNCKNTYCNSHHNDHGCPRIYP